MDLAGVNTIVRMMMMVIMIMIIIIIIIIIMMMIIMSVFLERLSCETCSNALNKCKYKNTKHMHTRHPKQHVSEQSCSNIQLRRKDGYIEKGMYPPKSKYKRIKQLDSLTQDACLEILKWNGETNVKHSPCP